MKYFFIFFALLCLFDQASAKGQCGGDPLQGSAQEKRAFTNRVIYNTPTHLIDTAKNVDFIVVGKGSIFPTAKNLNGTPVIEVHKDYWEVLCSLTLFISSFDRSLGEIDDVFSLAEKNAEDCRKSNADFSKCLIQYSNYLSSKMMSEQEQAARFESSLKQRDKNMLGTNVLSIARNLADQKFGSVRELNVASAENQFEIILAHEMAHQIFSHFEQLSNSRSSLQEIESEADLYSIQTAIDTRTNFLTNTYYYLTLNHFEEGYFGDVNFQHYQSGYCRGGDTFRVLQAIGLSSISARSLVSGQLKEMDDFKSKDYRVPIRSDKCKMFDDKLKNVISLNLERTISILFEHQEAINVSDRTDIQTRAKVKPEWAVVLTKLIEASNQNSYFDCHMIAHLVQRASQSNLRTYNQQMKEQLLSLRPNCRASDYGRILNSLGHFEKATDQNVEYFSEAVKYNPSISEAWVMLALNELEKKNCTSAVTHLEKAIETSAYPNGQTAKKLRQIIHYCRSQ